MDSEHINLTHKTALLAVYAIFVKRLRRSLELIEPCRTTICLRYDKSLLLNCFDALKMDIPTTASAPTFESLTFVERPGSLSFIPF